MKEEIAAGAVIMRNKASMWEVLLIRDMKGILTFPKGFMEQGETIEETARREAGEETGSTHLIYQTALPDVSYFYTRDGKSMKKTVHYVLFFSEKESPMVPQTEEGITEILWMPIEKAIDVIGYEKSNKPVLEAASAYIRKRMEKSLV